MVASPPPTQLYEEDDVHTQEPEICTLRYGDDVELGDGLPETQNYGLPETQNYCNEGILDHSAGSANLASEQTRPTQDNEHGSNKPTSKEDDDFCTKEKDTTKPTPPVEDAKKSNELCAAQDACKTVVQVKRRLSRKGDSSLLHRSADNSLAQTVTDKGRGSSDYASMSSNKQDERTPAFCVESADHKANRPPALQSLHISLPADANNTAAKRSEAHLETACNAASMPCTPVRAQDHQSDGEESADTQRYSPDGSTTSKCSVETTRYARHSGAQASKEARSRSASSHGSAVTRACSVDSAASVATEAYNCCFLSRDLPEADLSPTQPCKLGQPENILNAQTSLTSDVASDKSSVNTEGHAPQDTPMDHKDNEAESRGVQKAPSCEQATPQHELENHEPQLNTRAPVDESQASSANPPSEVSDGLDTGLSQASQNPPPKMADMSPPQPRQKRIIPQPTPRRRRLSSALARQLFEEMNQRECVQSENSQSTKRSINNTAYEALWTGSAPEDPRSPQTKRAISLQDLLASKEEDKEDLVNHSLLQPTGHDERSPSPAYEVQQGSNHSQLGPSHQATRGAIPQQPVIEKQTRSRRLSSKQHLVHTSTQLASKSASVVDVVDADKPRNTRKSCDTKVQTTSHAISRAATNSQSNKKKDAGSGHKIRRQRSAGSRSSSESPSTPKWLRASRNLGVQGQVTKIHTPSRASRRLSHCSIAASPNSVCAETQTVESIPTPCRCAVSPGPMGQSLHHKQQSNSKARDWQDAHKPMRVPTVRSLTSQMDEVVDLDAEQPYQTAEFCDTAIQATPPAIARSGSAPRSTGRTFGLQRSPDARSSSESPPSQKWVPKSYNLGAQDHAELRGKPKVDPKIVASLVQGHLTKVHTPTKSSQRLSCVSSQASPSSAGAQTQTVESIPTRCQGQSLQTSRHKKSSELRASNQQDPQAHLSASILGRQTSPEDEEICTQPDDSPTPARHGCRKSLMSELCNTDQQDSDDDVQCLGNTDGCAISRESIADNQPICQLSRSPKPGVDVCIQVDLSPLKGTLQQMLSPRAESFSVASTLDVQGRSTMDSGCQCIASSLEDCRNLAGLQQQTSPDKVSSDEEPLADVRAVSAGKAEPLHQIAHTGSGTQCDGHSPSGSEGGSSSLHVPHSVSAGLDVGYSRVPNRSPGSSWQRPLPPRLGGPSAFECPTQSDTSAPMASDKSSAPPATSCCLDSEEEGDADDSSKAGNIKYNNSASQQSIKRKRSIKVEDLHEEAQDQCISVKQEDEPVNMAPVFSSHSVKHQRTSMDQVQVPVKEELQQNELCASGNRRLTGKQPGGLGQGMLTSSMLSNGAITKRPSEASCRSLGKDTCSNELKEPSLDPARTLVFPDTPAKDKHQALQCGTNVGSRPTLTTPEVITFSDDEDIDEHATNGLCNGMNPNCEHNHSEQKLSAQHETSSAEEDSEPEHGLQTRGHKPLSGSRQNQLGSRHSVSMMCQTNIETETGKVVDPACDPSSGIEEIRKKERGSECHFAPRASTATEANSDAETLVGEPNHSSPQQAMQMRDPRTSADNVITCIDTEEVDDRVSIQGDPSVQHIREQQRSTALEEDSEPENAADYGGIPTACRQEVVDARAVVFPSRTDDTNERQLDIPNTKKHRARRVHHAGMNTQTSHFLSGNVEMPPEEDVMTCSDDDEDGQENRKDNPGIQQAPFQQEPSAAGDDSESDNASASDRIETRRRQEAVDQPAAVYPWRIEGNHGKELGTPRGKKQQARLVHHAGTGTDTGHYQSGNLEAPQDEDVMTGSDDDEADERESSKDNPHIKQIPTQQGSSEVKKECEPDYAGASDRIQIRRRQEQGSHGKPLGTPRGKKQQARLLHDVGTDAQMSHYQSGNLEAPRQEDVMTGSDDDEADERESSKDNPHIKQIPTQEGSSEVKKECERDNAGASDQIQIRHRQEQGSHGKPLGTPRGKKQQARLLHDVGTDAQMSHDQSGNLEAPRQEDVVTCSDDEDDGHVASKENSHTQRIPAQQESNAVEEDSEPENEGSSDGFQTRQRHEHEHAVGFLSKTGNTDEEELGAPHAKTQQSRLVHDASTDVQTNHYQSRNVKTPQEDDVIACSDDSDDDYDGCDATTEDRKDSQCKGVQHICTQQEESSEEEDSEPEYSSVCHAVQAVNKTCEQQHEEQTSSDTVAEETVHQAASMLSSEVEEGNRKERSLNCQVAPHADKTQRDGRSHTNRRTKKQQAKLVHDAGTGTETSQAIPGSCHKPSSEHVITSSDDEEINKMRSPLLLDKVKQSCAPHEKSVAQEIPEKMPVISCKDSEHTGRLPSSSSRGAKQPEKLRQRKRKLSAWQVPCKRPREDGVLAATSSEVNSSRPKELVDTSCNTITQETATHTITEGDAGVQASVAESSGRDCLTGSVIKRHRCNPTANESTKTPSVDETATQVDFDYEETLVEGTLQQRPANAGDGEDIQREVGSESKVGVEQTCERQRIDLIKKVKIERNSLSTMPPKEKEHPSVQEAQEAKCVKMERKYSSMMPPPEKVQPDAKRLKIETSVGSCTGAESPVPRRNKRCKGASLTEDSGNPGTSEQAEPEHEPPRDESMDPLDNIVPNIQIEGGTLKDLLGVSSTSTVKPSREGPKVGDPSVSAKPVLQRIQPKPGQRCFATTGLELSGRQKRTIEELGGILANDWSPHVTHLVADTFRRTAKMMCTICCGANVVIPDYITACRTAGKFVDETPFLLQDEVCEAAFARKRGMVSGYSLTKALQSSRKQGPLLKGISVYCFPSVVEKRELALLVASAGGTWLNKFPAVAHDDSVLLLAERTVSSAVEQQRRKTFKVYDVELLREAACTQELRKNVYSLR